MRIFPFGKAFTLLLLFQTVFAQHQDILEKPNIWKGPERNPKNQNSPLNAFKNGTIHGHFRYFYSHTDNNGLLSDYFAKAFGGGFKYESAPYKNFQYGLGGFYIFNLHSSPLDRLDSLSNKGSRYELELFDITDPRNRHEMDRLEEFYIKYNFGKKSSLKVGRQLINTPFINLQDGRMRPTAIQGIWSEINEFESFSVDAGIFNSISPRSTISVYKIGESIGLFPQGFDETGHPNHYHDHVKAQYVALAGLLYHPKKYLQISNWHMLIDNVMYSTFVQADAFTPTRFGNLFSAVQGIFQHAIGNGGNDDPQFRYIPIHHKAATYGLKAGLDLEKFQFSLNYNRITSQGRYIMPREWGREPFFTFIPRERNEGAGDVHAYALKITYEPSESWVIAFHSGYFDLPNIDNVRLNKYKMPSYYHINLDVYHEFKGVLEGLDMHVLITSKINAQDQSLTPDLEINRVNMLLYNAVINYHF
ncbi:MAG: OprD family outer membrane porin [Thermaurantimonas sp.]|uniref:OprD family outer membrane porin n=1 Tax=Thermaurantimonas sp. TaxID=2681568 RepID=UPI00391D2468